MEKEQRMHFVAEPDNFIGFGSQRWARDKDGVERLFVSVYLSVLARPVDVVFDDEAQFKKWCEDLIKDIKNVLG